MDQIEIPVWQPNHSALPTKLTMPVPKPPILTIVIPLFNRELLVGETIASIQAQCQERWECIVVDDGSRDCSQDVVRRIAESDPRVKLFSRPPSMCKGPSSCRNYGFSQSSSDWIWFLDSDDLLAEGALTELSKHVKDRSTDCIIGMYDYLKEQNGAYNSNCWNFDPENAYLKHVTQECALQTSVPIWHRHFLQSRRGELWDPDVHYNEDYEFYARLLAESPKIKVVQRVLFFYRLHEGARSVALSRKKVGVAERNRIRISKLDARLKVFEQLSRCAKTRSERSSLAHVRRRVLRQIVQDRRFTKVDELLYRFRDALWKRRTIRSRLAYLVLPLVIRTGRGLRFI